MIARLEPLRRSGGLAGVIAILTVVFSLVNSNFFTSSNILEVFRSGSSLTIVSIGLTLVIIVGELDLSIGVVYGLGAMVTGLLCFNDGVPVWIALIAGVACGAAVGMVNAALVTLAGIPSFIVTLGAYNFVQGVTLGISNAGSISPLPGPGVSNAEVSFFGQLGGATPLGIPVQVLWMAGIVVVMGIVLHKSLFGFRLYAIGGNAHAARFARLPVNRYKFIAFVLSGALAAVAGILDFSFLGETDPSSGIALTFPAFAAVIIGGTSLTGGRGSIFGTVLGALLLALLTNGLNLIGVGSWAQLVVIGGIVVVAVWLDRLSVRSRRAR